MSDTRNLEVPYFSQRRNNTVWYEHYPIDSKKVDEDGKSLAGKLVENGATDSKAKNSCNITCLAMILHYFGVTEDTPDEMMRKIFDPSKEELEAYTQSQKDLVTKAYTNKQVLENINNLKTFSEEFYKVQTEISTKSNFAEIKKEILAGYPVLVSCGLLQVYEQSEYVPISKEDAYYAIFKKEGSEKKYDDKISEYINLISENNKKLENDNLAIDDKEKITKEIEKFTENKNKLENKYNTIYEKYLNEERYHGHFIVLRGVTEKGVIINDPWGKPIIQPNGKATYSIMDGDNVELKDDEFKKQYFPDGHFWSCLIIHAKHWKFISRNKEFDVDDTDFLKNCHEAELFEHGGFPIKRSNLWHNGVHFGSKIGDDIYPIGAGQLIAARIINKDVENDKAPKNGSRCFVLVKHQIKINEQLKDFFVCYMHLEPVKDFDIITDKYPSQKTNIKWLDEILERSKNRNRVSAALKITDRDFYESNDTKGEKVIGKLPNSGVFIVNKIVDDKIFFYHEKDKVVNEYWVKKDSIYSADDKTEAYQKKIEELKTGKVVYFSDIKNDSCVEVTNSMPIGRMGEFSGLSCDNKIKSIHFEIFSNSLVIDNKSNDFRIIELSDLPKNLQTCDSLCNREEMIKFFEDKQLYGNVVDKFLNLKQNGVISKSEMLTFYKDYEYSKIFQKYIVQHISEWSDKINWEEAFKQAKGVPNKYFLAFLPKNEDFVGNLEEYVNSVYEPYKWLNNDCISAMKTEDNNLRKGVAYFYHPVKFIEWLNKNEV